MQDQFDVSVVIGTYNRCHLLAGALECLTAQECPGIRYELIVVDNNSTDNTYVSPRKAILIAFDFMKLHHIPHLRQDFTDNAQASVLVVIEHRTAKISSPHLSCGR